MKSQQDHQKVSETIQSPPIDHFAFDHENLHCSKGNTAVFLCQNKNCQGLSMICSQKDCECQQTHKKCLKTFSEEFFTEINKKIQPTNEIKQRVDKIIDDAIDFISNIRDEIHENLKYLGLNQDEKNLIEFLNQKDYNQISGSRIWKICQKIYQEKEIESKYIIKSINSFWIQHEEKFKNHFERIRDLSEKQGRTKNIFKDSDIITTDEDSEILSNFFTDQISSVSRQLYSASRSGYNMKKYHQNCDGKKGLLYIMKGINGKIFGGFWPNELPKGAMRMGFGGAVVELSPKSFIFSLSNKDKFKLIEGNSILQNYDAIEGPNFGNDCLGIYRKMPQQYAQHPPAAFGGFGTMFGGGRGGFGNATEVNNQPVPVFGGFGNNTQVFNNGEGAMEFLNGHYCVVLEGQTYTNPNYDRSPESRMKFAGTDKTCFEIKEWEVYQIKFIEKEEGLFYEPHH